MPQQTVELPVSQTTTTPPVASDDTPPPSNLSDVNAEFQSLTAGSFEPTSTGGPQQPEAPAEPEAPEDIEPGLEGEPEGELEGYGEPATDEEKLTLKAEVDALRSQLAAFTAGVGYGQGGGAAAAPMAQPRGEITIGEIAAPYQPAVKDEWLADRAFLGIAPGVTVEDEFDAALSTPAALNGFANRVRRSAIRDILQALPTVLDGYMNQLVAKGSLQQEFYRKNGDLEENAEVVEAIAERIRAAEPHLTKTQFLQKLSNTARLHLKKQRPATKSGGTQRMAPVAQQGSRGAKPALAGGTGTRRAAPSVDPNSIQSYIDAMRRAEQ